MDLENLVASAKWRDEDADGDDIKDNWDDEDEEPVVKPAEQKGKANSKAKKLNASQSSEQVGGGKPLTKLQEEKLQKESELKLTKQMLGMEDKDIALEFPLNTKEDFDKFHKNLVHKLWCYDKSPHYAMLLDKLFRDLCVPLEADDLKGLSSSLNALFNEKVRVSKNKPKKKGGKVAIKLERNNLGDMDDLHDLDDIM